MTDLLAFSSFYLVGIKGVAMTSLAQCLLDADKKVTGSDVTEEFVTQPLLNQHHIRIDFNFDPEKITGSECVIYTSAHGGPDNPQVKKAQSLHIPTFSQAEALAYFFNLKQGIAVCGVGGKSTTSAMIAFIMDRFAQSNPDFKSPSYSVGVGSIPGLDATGSWNHESQYFVAEADEYVTDPQAPARGDEITPRFSFLHPAITICTNLKYDHPDVYRNFEHTQHVYENFFSQQKPNGILIVNSDDQSLHTLAKKVTAKSEQKVITYGSGADAQFQLASFVSEAGYTTAQILINEQQHQLELQIPGEFNLKNALAALAATTQIEIPIEKGIQYLAEFKSTKRRSEFVGIKQGVRYYDDYAHHPDEVKSIISAFTDWFPDSRLVIAFQSHTYSRTKQLFNQFVEAFAQAHEVVMIDIFSSAREQKDDSVSSDVLCEAIEAKHPSVSAKNLKTISNLAEFCKTKLQPGDILLTVGAGDIYKVHDVLN